MVGLQHICSSSQAYRTGLALEREVAAWQGRACSKVIQASPGGLMKMPFSAASHTGSAPNASSSRPCAKDVVASTCWFQDKSTYRIQTQASTLQIAQNAVKRQQRPRVKHLHPYLGHITSCSWTQCVASVTEDRM